MKQVRIKIHEHLLTLKRGKMRSNKGLYKLIYTKNFKILKLISQIKKIHRTLKIHQVKLKKKKVH